MIFEKDISTWLNLMVELAEDGVDFSIGDYPSYREECLTPFLWDTIVELQKNFYQGLKEDELEFFEKAARNYLEFYFKPSDVIVMEGFTFLTKLQRYFVEIANEMGAHVIFIVPFNNNQIYGFEIIRDTYSDFEDIGDLYIDNAENEVTKEIKYLQDNLFTGKLEQGDFKAKNNVELNAYINSELEIRACLKQIQTWLDEGYVPEEIAVVMRNFEDYTGTFHDYLAMNPLIYKKNGEKLKVKVYTPPRLLLLTPLGRFVLSLYEIWENGALKIDSDQLETIIASGWLGSEVQDSAGSFRAIKSQYFNLCKSEDDWKTVLDQLLEDIKGDSSERLPISLLIGRETDIKKWVDTIETLRSVCQKLFDGENGSIARHIRKLRYELNRLVPEDIRQTEEEVLNKIEEVFIDLEKAYSINMSTEEFSKAINSLTAERQDSQKETSKPGYLWMTTPEGIDNISRKCVIYIGVDNQSVPLKASVPWPFCPKEYLEKHTKKERYMFLTVIRSATDNLILSYAQNDGKHILQPSMYLNHVKFLLSKPKIKSKNINNDLNIDEAPDLIINTPFPYKPREYSINELAHYGLCPLRYRLEKLDHLTQTYRNNWQMKFLVQGLWLKKVFEDMTNKYSTKALKGKKTERYQKFLSSVKAVKKDVIRYFPSFTDVEWKDIEKQIDNMVEYLSKSEDHYGKYHIRFINKNWSSYFRLALHDEAERFVTINFDVPFVFKRGYYVFPELAPLRSNEWLIYGKKPDQEIEFQPNENIDGVLLFDSQYQAVTWWMYSIRGFFKDQETDNYENFYTRHYDNSKQTMRNWIDGIESSIFPANNGKHCEYCPVRLECLEIETEEYRNDSN